MTQCGKYSDPAPSTRTIVLVGMMGAGKSTVGRRLAAALGMAFFDADAEIEKAAGMSVAELFKAHGEESFRRGEAKIIKRLLEGPPHVLATGGGALLTPHTRKCIADGAISIWLWADTATIVRRASRRGTRPLLKSGDPTKTIIRLMEERGKYYRAADIHIESRPGPHTNTVNAIIDAVTKFTGAKRKTTQDASV